MSSYRQHLYHIVFRTKKSNPAIAQDHVRDLNACIALLLRRDIYNRDELF